MDLIDNIIVMKKIFLFLTALVAVSCSEICMPDMPSENNQTNSGNTQTRTEHIDMPKLMAANTSFALNLFKSIANAEPETNICISPIGASYALALMANGADDATLDKIMLTLGFNGGEYNIEDLNNLNKELYTTLQSRADYFHEISISNANTIWTASGIEVIPKYAATLAQYYDATPMHFIPGTEEGKLAINGWCADKTGSICNLLTKAPDGMALLLNSFFFKCRFLNPFRITEYDMNMFTNSDGKQVSRRLMKNTRLSPCFIKCPDYQVISLRLGTYYPTTFYLDIILPDENVPINSFITRMDDEMEAMINGNQSIVSMVLCIPQLNMSYYCDLARALESIGMKNVFDTPECFPNMFSDSNISITQSGQLTVFSVNEYGIHASSSNYDADGRQCGEDDYYPNKINVKVLSPFVFQVRESYTGAILYMGVVRNLKEEIDYQAI